MKFESMNASLNEYVTGFEDLLKLQTDPLVAQGASAYMRNQFDFIGVKAPARREPQALPENAGFACS